MAKQLNVSLNFTANTAQAKAQMQELQRQLNSLTSSLTTADLPITKEVKEATVAAANLKVALAQSMNVDTGKFDLSKFNNTLKKSGTNLEQIHKQLTGLGADGRKAFMSLAQSIAAAEIPSRRVNSTLNEMWITMKNTARWQLSSSALHAFSGALHSAFGYAKDLNESLNNIRIVTGQSTDQMAEFAEKANKAAKALSTTTTRYTDAALIYYQQGLSDQEVEARTNTTVKMANVTGENAQEVSSYMTAIWNNFDDGSKSLEYFADVITKLGAETAASSAEIAGGLEKFAAIGETVGLSYEYATAALTTIIDKTRQSEDVVGTALKTIFARIQGLKLGEETEDGLDLNKYSAALDQYGISIFDANNELKDMDAILDEMGAKWDTLNRAQKVGLAQTVAGTRQYAQLVSLMDNWDSMQKNLDIATGSEGSLDKQAEIYEESWEAASTRVRAALESIFSDLIDDEFFIDLLNTIEKILTYTDQLIDGIGGLKGILAGVSTIILRTFTPQIAQSMQNMVYNVKSFMGVTQKEAQEIKLDAFTKAANMPVDDGSFGDSEKAELRVMQQRLQLQQTLNQKEAELSQTQKEQIKELETIHSITQQNYIIAEKEKEAAIDKLNNLRLENNINGKKDYKYNDKWTENYKNANTNVRNKMASKLHSTLMGSNYQYTSQEATKYVKALINIVEAEEKATQGAENFKESSKNLANTIKNLPKPPVDYYQVFTTAASGLSSLIFGLQSLKGAFETIQNPDLSDWEKFTTLMGQLVITIPMLLSGLNSLKTAYTALGLASKTQSLGLIISTKGINQNTVSLLSNIAAKYASVKATNEENAQNVINAGTRLLVKRGLDQETASKIINIITTKGLTKATWAEITALLTLKTVLNSALIKFALIAAVVAGFILLVNKLTLSQKELNKSFDEYEEAADKVKSLRDEVDGVNNSIDELLSKGLSQLTEEEEEQLSLLRQQRLELEGQLAIAEKLRDNEKQEFINDFEKFVDQGTFSDYNKETLTDASRIGESNKRAKAEKNLGLSGLSDIAFYDTAAIDAYEDKVKSLMRDKKINESNQDDYNQILDEISRLRNLGADNAEQLQTDYEQAKAYLQSDNIDKESEYYTQATAAIAKYYDYLGDAINFKDDIIKQYEVSENELTRLQGVLGEKEGFSEEELENILPTDFYEKLKQMSEETGTDLAYLADKLGLFSDSVNKLSQQDVFDNLRALLEGKTDSNGSTLSGVLESHSFSDGATSVNLGTNNLQDIFKQSGLSVQEQQDILLNIDWANQTQAESVLQALQQIEELNSDKGMVQEAISLGYSEEQFEAMTAGIMRTNEAFKDNEQLAQQAAIYQMRLSKALEGAAEVWDDYGDALEEADENNSDYYEGLGALADTLTENLGFEVDWSDVEDNLDLVKKAMEGDADAAAELAQQLAFDSVDTKLDELVESDFENLKTSLQALGDELPTELSGLMDESVDTIKTKWQETQDYLDNNDLAIGAYVEDAQVYESLNNMIAASGMTAEEAQNYLSSIGYEGEIDTHDVKMPGSTSSGSVSIGPLTIPYTFTQDEQTISVPFIKDASLKKTATKTSLKNVSKGSQTKSSKSGSEKEKERYHTVSKQMDSLDKQYDIIGSKKDAAFGANKLEYMEQEINALDALIAKNDEYIAQIEENLLADQAIMNGYGAKYDEFGNITNYDALFDKYGQDEVFQDALANYEDSVERFADATQDKLNKELEKQSKRYEQYTYKINLKVELNEMEMDWLDYNYSKLEGDVYKSAEAMGILRQQVDQTEVALADNGAAVEELNRLYAEGEITEDDYIAGLKEQYSATLDNLEALRDYDEMMKEYYGNTLQDAIAEMSEYMEQFDNMSSALSHYQNILKLTGQENDYKKMGVILDGQVEIAQDRLTSATEWYELQKQLQADLEKEFETNQSESVKNALEAQKKATAEAYEDMLEAGEATAEAVAAIFENEMKQAQEALEKSLSGGLGFDRLKESMQHVSDIQDEYLTKTNQVYEANKLLNNINNDMNKTNSVAAKQRLGAFAEEIEQLKKKDKLSNLELEIAQAKYKQMQAQIALEEAQNAKSVVRLSRDNEGNYGYVYTSDEEAVSSAEQELADAENDLYNIKLEAANEYGQKIIQLNEELAQKLAEIDNDTSLSDEERKARREEVLQQHYEKLGVYTDLYGIAQADDARVVEDAWVNTYSDIITAAEDHKKAVELYSGQAKTAFDKWQAGVATVKQLAGDDLDTLKGKVSDVTTESDNLRKKLTEGEDSVISSLGKTLKDSQKLTAEYGLHEKAVDKVEKQYEQLCKDLKTTITHYTNLKTAAKQAADEMSKVPSTTKVTSAGGGGKDAGDVDDTNKGGDGENKKTMKIKGYLDGRETFTVGNGGDSSFTNVDGTRYLKTPLGYVLADGVKLDDAKSYGGVGVYKAKANKVAYYEYVTMATGGYTGEWGPEGKMAMLHEKEIVLNKEDTENLLKVVEIVRTIIDSNAANAGLGILHSPGINTQNQNLEQTVTITAEFPNATNHDEIKMAFDSLINRASQYANRK